MENVWKASSQFAHRSLSMPGIEMLKLAEEKKKATDESIIVTNAKNRAAEAMATSPKQELEASKAEKKVLDLHKKQVKDEESTQSGLKALSSFLALPVELHLQVILNLTHSIDPGLVSLREVNRYFQSIISSAHLHTWGTTLLENKQFKAADRLYGFLRVEGRLPCTLCQCLLPKEKFHMEARQGKKALGHKLGHKRFCMDCGIKHRKFGGGNSVKVDDQTDHYRTVCRHCLEFLDGPECIPYCRIHFLLSDNEKQRLKLLRLRESGPSN